jgi:hypothetical protein
MNESSIPSKAEQIEALIHEKAYELALKYAGREQFGKLQFSKVFNVTRKEILEYLKNNYCLDNLPFFVFSSPGKRDGIYIIPVPEGYHVFYQEREYRNPDYTVPTEDDAWIFYIDFMLSLSGTALNWQ